MAQKISLIDLPRALRDQGVTANYSTVWRAAVDGRIPATRDGRRWWIDPSDMPTIMRTLSTVNA